jgi:hypothetical protein
MPAVGPARSSTVAKRFPVMFPLPPASRPRQGRFGGRGRRHISMSDVSISYARSTAVQAQQVATSGGMMTCDPTEPIPTCSWSRWKADLLTEAGSGR